MKKRMQFVSLTLIGFFIICVSIKTLKATNKSLNTFETIQCYPNNIQCISPDSSWKIDLQFKASRLIRFKIQYSNGMIITHTVANNHRIAKPLDATEIAWKNDSVLSIFPTNKILKEIYEMQFLKNGTIKTITYQSLVAEEKSIETKNTTAILEEKPIEPTVINSFYKKDRILKFSRQVSYPADPRVGCSESSNEFSFTIPNCTDSFNLDSKALKNCSFEYHIQGGLYWANSKEIIKGSIKGFELSNKSWQLLILIWVKMQDETTMGYTEQKIELQPIFTAQ